MIRWYFRNGTAVPNYPTGSIEWEEAMKKINRLLGDPDYKIIKQTTLPNGIRVSTVWLGLDQNMDYMDDPNGIHIPLIFETMVFTAEKREVRLPRGRTRMISDELDMERYSTEDQALEGHERFCRKYKNRKGGKNA